MLTPGNSNIKISGGHNADTDLQPVQEHFRLGIFTSATQRTARGVVPQLEAAAGAGTPLFSDASLILHR